MYISAGLGHRVDSSAFVLFALPRINIPVCPTQKGGQKEVCQKWEKKTWDLVDL